MEVPKGKNNYLNHYLKNRVWDRGGKQLLKEDLYIFFKRYYVFSS